MNFLKKKVIFTLFTLGLHSQSPGPRDEETDLLVITEGLGLPTREREQGSGLRSQQCQSNPSSHKLYTFLIAGPTLSILLKYENPTEVHLFIQLPIVNEYDKAGQILMPVSPGRLAALLLSFSCPTNSYQCHLMIALKYVSHTGSRVHIQANLNSGYKVSWATVPMIY